MLNGENESLGAWKRVRGYRVSRAAERQARCAWPLRSSGTDGRKLSAEDAAKVSGAQPSFRTPHYKLADSLSNA